MEKEKARLGSSLTRTELELADSISQTRLLKEEMEMMESKQEEGREVASAQQEQQMEEL